MLRCLSWSVWLRYTDRLADATSHFNKACNLKQAYRSGLDEIQQETTTIAYLMDSVYQLVCPKWEFSKQVVLCEKLGTKVWLTASLRDQQLKDPKQKWHCV